MKDEKKVLMKVRNLTKEFKIKASKFGEQPQILHAVNDVSVDIYEGETLGIIGESGCGKSTFGKTLIQSFTKPLPEVWSTMAETFSPYRGKS